MASTPSHPAIRIGPAGWSYPDWRGIVYPKRKLRGFHELEYLAQFFDAVEINTSFYNSPRPNVVKEWLLHVEHNEDFQFTAKLWQRFTHERNAAPDDEHVFKQGIAPLAEAGRLGALLLQFPWSFKNDPNNRQYLAKLCTQFREYPLVVEVRHSSWNQPEILEMLCELGAGFCNIDQPVIGRSIKPSQHVTALIGYVRLHGRNYKEWFSSNHNPVERYNYLYSLEELEPWIERTKAIAKNSKVTFVITTNHFRGKGVVNALQLIALVTARLVEVPEELLAHYPELAEVAILHQTTSAVQTTFPFEAAALKRRPH
ncbi:MAG: DUF72 domain-containing protein [Terriglobia bacterium]